MAQPPRKKTGKRLGRNTKPAHSKPHATVKKHIAASQNKTATIVLLNKPFGYVSQFSGDGKTLADLVPVKGVYPAGRLDKDSEGLLLLTNHGSLQHRISHPDKKWQKRYWVQVEGTISKDALQNLITGVILKDGVAKAISAQQIEAPDIWPRDPPIRYRANVADCWIEIVLDEGRNRQVRRMTAAVGFPTLRLIRHRIGCWDLTDLESGKYHTISLSARALEQIRG